MYFTLASLALLGVASAAPTLKHRSISTSSTFNLVYKSNSNAPDAVAALNNGTWYATASTKSDHLTLSSTPSDAALFYKYLDSNSYSYVATADTGITIMPGGTATVPGGKPITLQSNNGTAGTEIVLNASGLPTLWYDDGRFQACAGTDGEFSLVYVSQGQRFLADCVAVELQAVCASGDAGSLGKAVDVGCVAN